jgi:hypothetical protein
MTGNKFKMQSPNKKHKVGHLSRSERPKVRKSERLFPGSVKKHSWTWVLLSDSRTFGLSDFLVEECEKENGILALKSIPLPP